MVHVAVCDHNHEPSIDVYPVYSIHICKVSSSSQSNNLNLPKLFQISDLWPATENHELRSYKMLDEITWTADLRGGIKAKAWRMAFWPTSTRYIFCLYMYDKCIYMFVRCTVQYLLYTRSCDIPYRIYLLKYTVFIGKFYYILLYIYTHRAFADLLFAEIYQPNSATAYILHHNISQCF